MKKHKAHTTPLADEQLLFTPEEMFGEESHAPSAPSVEAPMPDEEKPVEESKPEEEKKAAEHVEKERTKAPETPPQAPETPPQTLEELAKEKTSEAPQQQYTPHWAQTVEPDKAIEAFVDEDRIVTEMTIALEFVDSLSLGETRLIALEASVKWQNGIRPTGTYTIQSLPRYTFDGYKFLALYYVSFYQAFPSMIDKLNMPYDRLYLQARQRYDGYRKKP